MVGMDNIEKLYQNYEVISNAVNKNEVQQHEKEFIEILKAVKGSDNEKRLASQFIVRFFKHFPELTNQTIDAQLDLCEDENVAIRKQAIKDLPSLCRDRLEYLPKLADVLAQLLQTNEPSELLVVQNSLMTLFQIDAKGTLGGLFSQIIGGEDIVRERAIKFLLNKVKTLGSELLTPGVEDILIQETKKALQDVTAEEFVMFMTILQYTSLSQTISGRQHLVELVEEQAELDKPFNPSEPEQLDRLMQCIRHALPYFSEQVSSKQFVQYLCKQVIPQLHKIKNSEESLEILKFLAEMSTFTKNLNNDGEPFLASLYKMLLQYLPLPSSNEENDEQSLLNGADGTTLQLSHVEALLLAFHRLGASSPSFLSEDEEKLKDLRQRLQFLARGIQGYIKQLRQTLAAQSGMQLKAEENHLKVIALKTTSNISALIKDFFHSPPIYKSNPSPSWRPLVSPNSKISTKRKPITFSDSTVTKQARGTRELYHPPGGKYSNKVQGFGE